MKIGALFADYDGTIAPLGVPRNESRIFRSVERELRRISASVPVCIVTAKDYRFIYPRSKFAAGWACVSGLDIRLADGRRFTSRNLADLGSALEVAEECEHLGSFTEVKRGASGELLGVGIDWSGVPESGAAIMRKVRRIERMGHILVYDGRSTFADVYAAAPDKGKASRILKNVLVKESEVMFIGDSAVDNAAFEEAGVAIGVTHGQPIGELRCDFIVEQTKLAEFLRSLRDRGMEFTPSIPSVRSRRGTETHAGRSNNVQNEPHQRPGTRRAEDGEGVQEAGARRLPHH